MALSPRALGPILRAKGRLGATRKLSTSPPSLLERAEAYTSVYGTDYTSAGSQGSREIVRNEVEGRVASSLATWLYDIVPSDLRRQLDDGEVTLRAATTAIPTAIARASHAASAKGSPDRAAGVAAATVGPSHFYLGAQGCRFRHTSTLSAFKNAQDARSASTQLDRHSQRHRRQF